MANNYVWEKGIIKDKQERVSLVLFGSLIGVMHNDKYNNFKKMSVMTNYWIQMNDQLLKSTETSAVVEI